MKLFTKNNEKSKWFKIIPKKAKKDGGKENYVSSIAKERIDKLFEQADSAAEKKHYSEATRYIALARKIAMKHNLKLSSEQKKKFCHSCYSYVVPGKTLSVRINPDYQAVEYICQKCGKVTRYGYRNEKSEKSAEIEQN